MGSEPTPSTIGADGGNEANPAAALGIDPDESTFVGISYSASKFRIRLTGIGDLRLWTIIGLMAVFSVAWQLFALKYHRQVDVSTSDFLPIGVFLVPVIYASMSFGLGGGLVIALVSVVASIPWIDIAIRQSNREGAWFDVVQEVILVTLAYFIGKTVTSERKSREDAERSRLENIAAEEVYRDLFETNSQPIFLVSLKGEVFEMNAAAQELVGVDRASMQSNLLPELIGEAAFGAVRADATRISVSDAELVELSGGSEESGPTFRPMARMVTIQGQPMLQVILQDVTEDARRHRRARAYAADVLRGQEDERRRIAQELHDGPLQTLVHLCRMIDLITAAGITGVLSPDSGGKLGVPTLAQLRSSTESVVSEVRQISRGLRPPLLDDLGLIAALERLCDDVERRAGVAASLVVEDEIPRLSSAGELTVYRIAQEALSNIDHHAGASSVDVRLSVLDGSLHLFVRDDGEGFSPRSDGQVEDTGNLGLAGMSERASLVGGTLEVRSNPGEGTTVTLALPIVNPDNDLSVLPGVGD